MGLKIIERFCVECGGELVEPIPSNEKETPPRVCARCGFRAWEDPKVAVVVVVSLDGRIPLLRRAQGGKAYGRWVLPGGFVNRGEPVEEAARREVMEELGLKVELTGLVGVYSYTGDPVIVIAYLGEARGGELRGEKREALEVQSFGAEEIPWNDLGYHSTRDALRDVELRTRGVT